jgi:peroxiredoxin (alkyl hydroperoxide reductase subunit C)
MDMSLIGKKAPEFVAKAVLEGKAIDENYTLSDRRGKYVLLFFYPLDFTFVCPTELHAFQELYAEFLKRGCEVIGVSVDSHFSHLAWLKTPKVKGGIEGIKYPLVADMTKSIARKFGVLKEDEGIAYRGLFLLDREGIIRHLIINDLPLGRSAHEALRMLDALIFFEKHGEVCPANWKAGDKGMTPDEDGLKRYFSS